MAAAPAAAQPAGCGAPEQRQFDFWLGRWDVFTPDGRQAGENHIEAVAGGCALLERWSGRGGFSGQSLNSWDRASGLWRQHWVDSSGGLLRLEGRFEKGSMVLSGRLPVAQRPQATSEERITWTPQADGSVRQLWERREDPGGAWVTVFDGRYVKRP